MPQPSDRASLNRQGHGGCVCGGQLWLIRRDLTLSRASQCVWGVWGWSVLVVA